MKIERFRLSAVSACYLVFSSFYLFFATKMPFTIITWLGQDDALFWNQAEQIMKGHWLGSPYNNLTLVKGPFYQIFLALNSIFGTSVSFLTAALYTVACWFCARILAKLGLNRWFALGLFSFILFHPGILPTNIIRDNIYTSLLLLIFTSVLSIIALPATPKKQAWQGLGFGLIFGFYWLTREESAWIVPALFLLLLMKFIFIKKDSKTLKGISVGLGAMAAGAVIFIFTIATVNHSRYGKYELIETKNKAFVKALNALYNVEVGPDVPYLPVSTAKREVIYKISPSFAELKDYLEGTGRKIWTDATCSMYPATCGDYAGGWFSWALRDALASKGYYKNPQTAEDFYFKIAKEITDACNQGLIKCTTNPIPFFPRLPQAQMEKLPATFWTGIKSAMLTKGVSLSNGPSLGPFADIVETQKFLGEPAIMPPTDTPANATEIKLKKLSRIAIAIKSGLGDLYQIAISILVSFGLFAWLRYLSFLIAKRQKPNDLFLMATTMWCLAVTRIFLLTVLDLSWAAGFLNTYLRPAYISICIAPIISLALAVSLRHFRRTNSTNFDKS